MAKHFLFLILQALLISISGLSSLCRDPNSELAADERLHRKFILFGGEGGGLGNLLIFFPSVFYFAALTGREIVIVSFNSSLVM